MSIIVTLDEIMTSVIMVDNTEKIREFRLSDLHHIAHSVVDEPWGVGESVLANTESSPPYYRFLYKIVKLYKPEFAIECGTYLGIGAAHMAVGNKDTIVCTIDIDPHPKAYSIAALYSNIILIQGDTTDKRVYQEIKSNVDRRLDLLFLDSEHDGVTATEEYNLYKSLFADICVIACDDILDPRMSCFWGDLPGDKMELNFLHPAQYPGFEDPGFGISIVRK